MKNRIAIIDGLRSPLGKMGGKLKNYSADYLGGIVLQEFLARNEAYLDLIDEVVIGNVGQPANAANVARVIALRAGMPKSVPAFTVHRNCASGFESVTSASCKILAGEADFIIAGGVESMSQIPFLIRSDYKEFLENLAKARSFQQKLKLFTKFKLKFLKPEIGLKLGLTDPICNLIMGDTAEILAKEHGITRKMQDDFALRSHLRAREATEKGYFKNEIMPVINNPAKSEYMEIDEGIRFGQNNKDLAKLKPFFDRQNGTVTAGNSSQITDGAAFLLLCSETKAKKLKLPVLGYLSGFSYAGLEPERMGLGPVYATHNLLKKTKTSLKDYDLFEINEAFAAQVLACLDAFASSKFAKDNLNEAKALGEIDRDLLNVNGGSIALGHPVGMTGTRIIIQSLNELKRRKKNKALASLCIGGGQGGAVILESN